MKHKNRAVATSPAKAPSKPGKPRRTSSADNPAPTPATRPKRALTGRGTGGPTKPPAPAHDPDVETRAYGDELARLASEDERAARWRSLIQGDRPATGGEDGARRADFARQAAEALGWPGWATYERTGRFDPLRGNLPLLYANAAVVTVTTRPSMLGIILAALRKRAKPVADLARIRAAAAGGSIPGEWHLLDYAGPVYEIPEPRPGAEYARLVAAREAQEAAAAQVLADAAAGRLTPAPSSSDTDIGGPAPRSSVRSPALPPDELHLVVRNHANDNKLIGCVSEWLWQKWVVFCDGERYDMTGEKQWEIIDLLIHPTDPAGWVKLPRGWGGLFRGGDHAEGAAYFRARVKPVGPRGKGKGRFRLT